MREVDKTPAVPEEENPKPVEPPPEPLVVTRGQSAWFDVIPVARWEQRYTSNAQNDPLAKYSVRSLGGGLGGGYAFRDDDVPFVFETAADFNVWRFSALAPGALQQQGVNTLYFDLVARGGVPLVRNNDVDIEVGLGAGATTFIIDQLNDALGQPTKTFSSSLYLDALPYVSVRARVGGGHLGEVSATAAVGIGALFLLDDPANVELNQDQIAALNPGFEPIPEEPPEVDPDAPLVAPPPASDMSVALGIDLRLRYRYPLSDKMTLDFGGMVKARQSDYAGPGIRFQNVYTAASNVDFVVGATTGLTFKF